MMPPKRRIDGAVTKARDTGWVLNAASVLDIRDRFVGLAFAAADLLVEIGADHGITFAAGAFRERFGVDSHCMEGRSFASLIAPEDQGALEVAMQLFQARGRLTPISLRLANAERTPMALSGLRLPHQSGIAWLTLSRIPAAPPQQAALAALPLFNEAMSARSRSGAPSHVGLVEFGGWKSLDPTHRRELEDSIAQALRQAGGQGAMATEVAHGKFGVLGGEHIDFADLQRQIGAILRNAGASRTIAGLTIPLAAAGGPGDVADERASAATHAATMRAMRFALSRFAAGGTRAVRAAGFDRGLPGFLERAEARATIVRRAIEGGRFRLVFQPVVHLADRSVHHYEALLRPFPIAGHEECSTQDFVQFAEAVGLAELLDSAVLARASETLHAARSRVAINISGISMQSAGFRDKLLHFIAGAPAISQRLMIELTETADIDDVPGAVNTVTRLAAAGVPVCLDDFGAGYAAFRYLREFKVDFVKIDGSFVRQAATGARDSGFVSAMVELARCAGAQAIAEMVETEKEAASMRELGVQFGQGWLFGRPGSLPGSL
jgi:EAL domain-containing protein (putative c-di-GMP-specific phosphodiesterase class I)